MLGEMAWSKDTAQEIMLYILHSQIPQLFVDT